MSKLKEINSKYYEKVEVVMLATNKKVGLGNIFKQIEKNILWDDEEDFIGKLYLNVNPNVTNSNNKFEAQHLYFLSNEEIKEGDLCIRINPDNSTIGLPFKADSIIVLSQENKGFKKIITTTNNSLTYDDVMNSWLLPQPSQSFIQAYIKAYNEGKPITKVLVECWAHTEEDIQLKVNSSNEITTKKIKDSYTREEVIEFGLKCVNLGMNLENNPLPRLSEMSGKDYYYKWTEENL